MTALESNRMIDRATDVHLNAACFSYALVRLLNWQANRLTAIVAEFQTITRTE